MQTDFNFSKMSEFDSDSIGDDHGACFCKYGPNIDIPMDGYYCKNFAPDQLDEIEAFFKKFDFVVVRDIASEQLLDQLENEMKQIAGLPNDLR
jgi:hypothetical protein